MMSSAALLNEATLLGQGFNQLRSVQGAEALVVLRGQAGTPQVLPLIARGNDDNMIMIVYNTHIRVCLKMLCTPLYPMVLLIIIPITNGYLIGNIPYFQTNSYS